VPASRSSRRQPSILEKFRTAGSPTALSLHELRLAIEEAEREGTPDERERLARALRVREKQSR
jgi:hypothetical protein